MKFRLELNQNNQGWEFYGIFCDIEQAWRRACRSLNIGTTARLLDNVDFRVFKIGDDGGYADHDKVLFREIESEHVIIAELTNGQKLAAWLG